MAHTSLYHGRSPALFCVALGIAACAQKGTIPPSWRDDTAAEEDTSSVADTCDPGDTAEEDTSGQTYPPVSHVYWAVNGSVATVLEVRWKQDEAAAGSWLEFSFEDDVWQDSPEVARPAGAASEVILGTPADTDVRFRIANRLGDGTVRTSEQTWTGTTGSLPDGLPTPTLEVYDASLASADRYLLSSVDQSTHWYEGPFWVFILDRKGRYVWYYQVPDSKCTLFPQISGDGTHIVFDECTVWVFDTSAVPAIGRMTLDERWTEETELPSFRFGLEEIDDGTVFYNAQDGAFTLTERSPDGTERDIWDCSAWASALGVSPYSCLPNGIVYHPETDSILWSMFNLSTVVEIDRTAGEIVRRFGQVPGGYAFDPSTAMVDYQHYPNYGPDGALMLSTHLVDDTTEQQRAREFTVDDADETLVETWEYGEGVDEYAAYGGEAVRLPNGNALLNYGSGGALREVTNDKAVAWLVRWPTEPSTHMLGHQTLLDDLYALNEGPEGL